MDSRPTPGGDGCDAATIWALPGDTEGEEEEEVKGEGAEGEEEEEWSAAAEVA